MNNYVAGKLAILWMSTIRSFIETVTELEPLPAEEKPKQKKFTTKSAVAMLDVSPKKLRSLMDDDDEEGVSFVDFFGIDAQKD